ncbi:MAG TPA: 16S rRNA (adenine(1518)-N(6)/adenine(1519)-N(6))-dimethyltransferase RsmA [Actinomycetota bacterium]|nr:16S rRNA (adenine(1518)-N(6)/adenine(1519)-N(6))-dimethyltransferase RsmA [Actinomycetota bacterium]
MTGDRSDREGSSTSRRRRSPSSSRSGPGSSTFSSPGDGGLGAGAIRDLAARHGIRPSKSLGQHFLIDPNLARAIASDAGVTAGDRVVEIGAGMGSLTVALAATGAEVLAVEFDRGLVPALREVTQGLASVRVLHADAMKLDWSAELGDADGVWTLCANLPYNIAAPLVLDTLTSVPAISRWLVMVQREVGRRLVAAPGGEHFGAVSLRVAYRADASIVRRVPAAVFWPRPNVDSVLVRLDRLDRPPVDVDEVWLWRVVDEAFAERRKTMRNALRRLGLAEPDAVLADAGIEPATRPEELDLSAFAAIAERMAA